MTTFFDTNLLVYAFSNDPRSERAQTALSGGGLISVQILDEFTNVLRTKLKQDWSVIERATQVLRSRFPQILPLTVEISVAAASLARSHTLSFYDSLVIISALEADCETLLSEDMQHGRQFGKLTVRNPFL